MSGPPVHPAPPGHPAPSQAAPHVHHAHTGSACPACAAESPAPHAHHDHANVRPVEPYRSAGEHFDDHAVRLLLLLKHYVLRYWHRLTDAGGNLSDAYVSVQEALHSLGAHIDVSHHLPEEMRSSASREGLAAIEAELAGCDDRIQQRLACSMDGVTLPIEEIRAIFRLTDAEIDVLLVLTRIQHDLEFSRLCTFAWADFTRKQPDVAFLVDLLSVPAARRDEVTRALAPEGRLVSRRLVTLHDAGDWIPATPHFYRRLVVPDRLARLLNLGSEALAMLPRSMRWVEGTASLDDVRIDADAKQQAIDAWRAACANPADRAGLVLWGPRSAGKKTLAATLAASLGQRLLVIDVEALLANNPSEAAALIADGTREALLQAAVLLIELGNGSANADEHAGRHTFDALQSALDNAAGPVLFCASQPQPALAALGSVIDVHVPFTSLAEQQQTWRQALANGPALAAAIDPEYLAGRFNLTAGCIYRTVRSAAALASTARYPRDRGRTTDSTVGEAELAVAARNQVSHNLGTLATPVFTTLGWPDLVLPAETVALLTEIEQMMQHRAQVYDDWGFRRVVGGRQGLRVLFSGPPGTGKTLAASVIAKSLARDVYRIDLSRVLDKYIGETEKNLARLFDESEYAHVLLLFDEADSLFAGRTSVKSVHDRYANVQVNFLLQRIESFEGICILTTNFEENIDDAFKRRLQAWVRFPKPDRLSREELWRKMIPGQAAVAGRLDFSALASEFEFSGGHIKNAVLRAAFSAAADGKPIGLDHLRAAAVVEARQLGQLVRVPTAATKR